MALKVQEELVRKDTQRLRDNPTEIQLTFFLIVGFLCLPAKLCFYGASLCCGLFCVEVQLCLTLYVYILQPQS